MHPVWNKGIGAQAARQLLLMTNEKAFNRRRVYEALRQKFEPEAMKIAAELSIGLLEVSDWTLWRSQSPHKRKKAADSLRVGDVWALATLRRFSPQVREEIGTHL
jgi:hypothetical protein